MSGAIFGNKVAKISDTANLTVSTIGGGLTIEEHSRTVTRTMIPTAVICAVVYLVIGLFGDASDKSIDVDQVHQTIEQAFNVSWWAFVPILSIFVLSLLRFSAFMSLTLSALVSVVIAAFTQNDIIRAQADDPDLSYFESIIEVGIDVPNATVMVIEDADRFGLSQLHQLRGRVGRSARLAYAYLLLPPYRVITDQAVKRLKAIEEFEDLGSGFQLAWEKFCVSSALLA